MIFGYARVSTQDQNLDLQRDALHRDSCGKIFEEHASGARQDRPQLAKLMATLREGDTLVIWKLDRLGHTVRQLIDFVEDLKAKGVAFRSITDGIDTRTQTGRFMFHVLAALAEMERDMNRERTMAGLAAARSRGRNGGAKPKLLPDQVRAVKQLLADPERTVSDVARAFKVNRATIYRAIGPNGGK